MSFKKNAIRKILSTLGNHIIIIFFSWHFISRGDKFPKSLWTGKHPCTNQFVVKATSSLDLPVMSEYLFWLILGAMNKKQNSYNLASVINHFILQLIEKRRMLHILFVRKDGEADSATLFKITIFILMGIFP